MTKDSLKKKVSPKGNAASFVRISAATHTRLLRFCNSRNLKIWAVADAAIRNALQRGRV